MGWGDILKAFSFAAPVGQTLGPAMERGAALRDLDERRAATERGFQTLIAGLPDEYKSIKDAVAGGMPASAAIPALQGPFGSIMEHAQQMKRWNEIFPDQKSWDDPARQELAAKEGLLKNLPGPMLEHMFPKTKETKMYAGMPQEAYLALGDPAHPGVMTPAQKQALQNYHDLTTNPVKPTPPHWVNDSRVDTTSGYRVKTLQAFDENMQPLGLPRDVGIELTADQANGIGQAADALRIMPDAMASAQKIDAELQGMPAPDKRKKLLREFRSYTSGIHSKNVNPFNPASWGWWTSYPEVDPEYAEYFTYMGQLQAATAGPMKIFRSGQLFHEISPHIDDPNNLPADNIERIKITQQRWVRQMDAINHLQAGMGDPVSVAKFITAATGRPVAGTTPETPASMTDPLPAHPTPGLTAPYSGGTAVWR